MADTGGILRVVSPAELARSEAAAYQSKQVGDEAVESALARHIHERFEDARRHQTSENIRDGLLSALRAYRGEYSPSKRAEIAQFKGSGVYARMTAVKCRGATSILRDIFLAKSRPWDLEPTPDPNIPPGIMENILKLVESETQNMQLMGGGEPEEQVVAERIRTLMDAARKAERRTSKQEAKEATIYLDDILVEGGFYNALDEMLIDLPIFDFAVMKGPVIRMKQRVKWGPDGQRTTVQEPRPFWERVSPFDVFFSPGASRVEHSDVIERIRIPRHEFQALIGVEGYNEEAVRNVLKDDNSGSLHEWRLWLDGERHSLERRDNEILTSRPRGGMIDGLEYNGYVRGSWLLEWGVSEKDIPDPDMDYFSTCWLVGRYVIKAQLSLSPRARPMYYVTSFEKVPGSIYGHGLPNILEDIQEVVNATLRSLVNNLSISSGPQVIVNTDRSAPGADTENLYPWKRWYVLSDPLANAAEKPVDFFQPASNSQELLSVYKEFTNMADEISAIPRYLTGSQRTGGAAATASGLSMLMSNAGKVMQAVAANIDNDIIEKVVENIYEFVMLTDPGHLRGDEVIVVKGVTTSMRKEQDRVRQLEFLQLTGNPIDSQIMGVKGRASVLRSVAEGLGLDNEELIPSGEEMQKMAQAQPPPGALPPPGPDAAKSDAAGPRMDTVSNSSTA